MKERAIHFIRYLLILLCILLMFSLFRNISRTMQMRNTVAEAQKSLEELKSKQTELQQDLSIIGSDFYLEKEARNKLGLVKEDEIVIVLPEESILRNLSPRRDNKEVYTLPDPNWKRWAELFL